MPIKELKRILESPITKAAKGRFMSIEELEQIKTILEAWYIVKRNTQGNPFFYQITISRSDKEAYGTFEKALEVEENVDYK